MSSPITQRPASVTIPVLMVLFLGGGAAGVALARVIAPQSAIAALFGFFMLPAGFIAGLYTWLGTAMLDAFGQSVRRRRVASSAVNPPASPVHPAAIPRGTSGFVFTSLGTSVLSGIGIAFLSPQWAFLPAWGLVVLAGAGYGVLCWILARSGFLPFPEGS